MFSSPAIPSERFSQTIDLDGVTIRANRSFVDNRVIFPTEGPGTQYLFVHALARPLVERIAEDLRAKLNAPTPRRSRILSRNP